MKKFLTLFLIIAAMDIGFADDPEIHLQASQPIIVKYSNLGSGQEFPIDLKIITPEKPENTHTFTDFNSLHPKLYFSDSKQIIPAFIGTDAARLPSANDILNPISTKIVDIKTTIKFLKSQDSLLLIYIQPSGCVFQFKIKPGTYNLSFDYIVNSQTSDLFSKFDIGQVSLWQGKITSNSIILQIK